MERVKTFQLLGNSYELKYPTIDQIMQIESLKISLSRGKYSEWLLSVTIWAKRALDYTDVCSYFSVLCPKLLIDLKIDVKELDVIDTHKDLMKMYRSEFLPWWSEFEAHVKEQIDYEE